MSSQDKFLLRWTEHRNFILGTFDRLLQTKTLVDVTLACADGFHLNAHKVVLSACSPYFEMLFVENPCKHPIVIMRDVNYLEMQLILDFIYKGELQVAQGDLEHLLKTAKVLKINGLINMNGNDLTLGANASSQQSKSIPQPLLAKKKVAKAKRKQSDVPLFNPSNQQPLTPQITRKEVDKINSQQLAVPLLTPSNQQPSTPQITRKQVEKISSQQLAVPLLNPLNQQPLTSQITRKEVDKINSQQLTVPLTLCTNITNQQSQMIIKEVVGINGQQLVVSSNRQPLALQPQMTVKEVFEIKSQQLLVPLVFGINPSNQQSQMNMTEVVGINGQQSAVSLTQQPSAPTNSQTVVQTNIQHSTVSLQNAIPSAPGVLPVIKKPVPLGKRMVRCRNLFPVAELPSKKQCNEIQPSDSGISDLTQPVQLVMADIKQEPHNVRLEQSDENVHPLDTQDDVILEDHMIPVTGSAMYVLHQSDSLAGTDASQARSNDILSLGMKFDCFSTLKDAINRYKQANDVDLYVHYSRSVNGARKKGIKRYVKAELGLYEVVYKCVCSNAYYVSRSKRRKPNDNDLVAQNCEFRLRIRVTDDGCFLHVVEMNSIHDHTAGNF